MRGGRSGTLVEEKQKENRMQGKQPVAQVAGSVFMRRASRAAADTVDILIALGGVFCKVDPCSKHPSDVGMALIEAFVDDGVNEWRT